MERVVDYRKPKYILTFETLIKNLLPSLNAFRNEFLFLASHPVSISKLAET